MGRRAPIRVIVLLAVAITAGVALHAASRTGGSREIDAAPPPGLDAHRALERPTSVVVRATAIDALPDIEAIARSRGYIVAQRVDEPPSLYVALPDGVSLADGVGAFTAQPGVLYVEPAYPIVAADVPPDPLYASHQQAYLAKVQAPAAWDITTGSPDVVVAVLDTGIDVSHTDLQGRVWTNGADPVNGADDDGSGCVDDVNGCAFLFSPSEGCNAATGGNVADDVGHGTFVAGIIAANGDGAGMVGVARSTTVLPVKILDCKGSGNTFALAQGILYAAERGARVINVSLGGPVDSAYVRETIRIARTRYGSLLVAATGNNGGDVSYPARYDEVLAVGGTTEAGDVRAGYSNAGPEVDVVAVGSGIVGTLPAGRCEGPFSCLSEFPGHATANGTSFAAPQVSGLAALMFARNPFLAPDAVAQIIRSTADPLPPGDRPGWAGAGRINMLRAMALPFRLGTPGSTRS